MRKVFAAVLALAAMAIFLMVSIAAVNGDTADMPDHYRIAGHQMVRVAHPPLAPTYTVRQCVGPPAVVYPATIYTPVWRPAVVAQPVNVTKYRVHYWTPVRNALFGKSRTVVTPAPVYAVPQLE